MQPAQMWLIDGTGCFYQFFHAPFRNLSVRCSLCDSTGEWVEYDVTTQCTVCDGTGREPTKATYLFTKMILKLIRDQKPKYLAVVFDGPNASAYRCNISPDYKAQRPKERPKGVHAQLNRIKQILKALEIPVIISDGVEADDVLASIATKYADPTREIVIVSRDKDLLPLSVNPAIFCFDPVKRQWFSDQTAGKRFGVETKQLSDYFALVGDSVDNIRGVAGWGPKSAVKWLSKCGSLDLICSEGGEFLPTGLLNSLDKACDSGSLRKAQQLLALKTDVRLGILKADLKCPAVNLRRASPIFRLLNFKEENL